MTSVADASIVVAALLSEHGGAARTRLAAEPELHVPHLMDLEVLSALRVLHRNGSLSEHGARQARTKLGLLPLRRYPHGSLLSRVWELRDNLTVYGAAYVSLAEALDAPLLTADARLARAPGVRCQVELIAGT
ncbi:MAG TPA: type II toxin-antitoxin system VapC family toxin [Actinomycetes bacterium]|jgi:predicted nucleic acid-binding protein|nr:type II toxin-antitoxin system VapC family toxin [Actinomycetes bacterium]